MLAAQSVASTAYGFLTILMKGDIMFWVIYLTETDGDIMLWACNTMEEVENHVKMIGLDPIDYAIMKGERVKNFGRVCGSKKGKEK